MDSLWSYLVRWFTLTRSWSNRWIWLSQSELFCCFWYVVLILTSNTGGRYLRTHGSLIPIRTVLRTFSIILGRALLNRSVEEVMLIPCLPQTIPILTDVWIYDEVFKEKLEAYITQIFSYIEKYQIQIPLETYLVLEFRNKGRCGYYFVNHPKQSLFWLDEFDGMDFLYEVRVQYTPSLISMCFILLSEWIALLTVNRIDQQMKSLYWLV